MSIDLDAMLKALAHPLRREMLVWMKDPERYFSPQERPFDIGVCAGKFDERCGLSQSTVSAHLATLQRAGLISSRRIGQWTFFKRNETNLHAFFNALQAQLDPDSLPDGDNAIHAEPSDGA